MPVPAYTATSTQQDVGHLKLRGHHDIPATTDFPDLDKNGVSGGLRCNLDQRYELTLIRLI